MKKIEYKKLLYNAKEELKTKRLIDNAKIKTF